MIANYPLGARSRVQRPVRIHKREGGAVVIDPDCGSKHYLCMAAFASEIILHQAKADLSGDLRWEFKKVCGSHVCV
jgi:hypothetical protein